MDTRTDGSGPDGLVPDHMGGGATASLLYAANAVRAHLTATVLHPRGLSWTGFVVLYDVWVSDGLETRHAAEHAAISKATLTGVVKTLVAHGWLTRETDASDRRLVHLRVTASGSDLLGDLLPDFTAAESDVVARLTPRDVADLTRCLRTIVTTVEDRGVGLPPGFPFPI